MYRGPWERTGPGPGWPARVQKRRCAENRRRDGERRTQAQHEFGLVRRELVVVERQPRRRSEQDGRQVNKGDPQSERSQGKDELAGRQAPAEQPEGGRKGRDSRGAGRPAPGLEVRKGEKSRGGRQSRCGGACRQWYGYSGAGANPPGCRCPGTCGCQRYERQGKQGSEWGRFTEQSRPDPEE